MDENENLLESREAVCRNMGTTRKESGSFLRALVMSKSAPATPDTQFFLRDIFNTSPIGIAVENLDGQPLFVNSAFSSMLGFSEEELLTKHCVDFSPPEDAEKDWALFQQLRAGDIDHYQLEKRYFRRDGSLVWGSLSISLLNHRPSPLILAMVEDITDKKAAEESRFKHAAVVESAEDAIISKNLNGVIVSWNAGAQRMFGYTEQEAVGQPITLLIPLELREKYNQILERLRAEGRIEHYETKRLTKAGKKIDVSLRIGPIKDSVGKIVGFSEIAHDITDRKQAEEALRRSEELLKMFVKNVPAGVAMLDRDMRYLQVSNRFCTDYGLDRSQILGHSHYEVFPDLPERWKETHQRALEGETLRADEDRWDRRDGTTVWVRWEILPWRKDGGSVGGVLILTEDITYRRQMEDALSLMSRKLIESQEQERARIGRELHDDISQRLAMLSIDLEQLGNDPSASGNRLQKLRKDVDQLSCDVQALSHELHSSKLEYLGVVSGMKSWCREFGERQNMEIVFSSDMANTLSFEVGLPLFRVLQEALHNAVKHSGAKHVEVQLLECSKEVHLIISDSGTGFDVEAARQGRGLGLTSMQERARLVNGSVTVESQPMQGTTVHIRVPLKSEDAANGPIRSNYPELKQQADRKDPMVDSPPSVLDEKAS